MCNLFKSDMFTSHNLFWNILDVVFDLFVLCKNLNQIGAPNYCNRYIKEMDRSLWAYNEM